MVVGVFSIFLKLFFFVNLVIESGNKKNLNTLFKTTLGISDKMYFFIYLLGKNVVSAAEWISVQNK